MGVVAPRDPEKKRPGFYIMKNKDIFGAPTGDGRGVQPLYMSDGRIVSGAKLVGQVEDEEELNMLVKTADFRKLVHSIGVSVEADDCDVDFVFQMYGKTDPYVSGTSIKMPCQTDGFEQVVKLSEVNWSDDDDIIGQIRFEMSKEKCFAKVSVKLYLNDGYTAPEVADEGKVDFESEKYSEMLDASVVSAGNMKRLRAALNKAKAGEEMTVAFIGGSITQGAGAIPINTQCYAYKTYSRIKELCGGGDNVKYVKAGVGGTPSELGMIRFDRDVLRDGKVNPDIVVVEFAVNDAGDETNGHCYESLVRKIMKLPNAPAVILIFSVFADDYNLEDRLIPIGLRYELPMTSVKRCVTPQFTDKENRVIGKSGFFYDCYHPTNDGHTIMADCIIKLVNIALEKERECAKLKDDLDVDKTEFVYGKSFDDIKLLDRADTSLAVFVSAGDFDSLDSDLQGVEMDLDVTQTKEFPNNWKHVSGDTPFAMDIECRTLVMVNKDSASANAGIAEVYVDGEKAISVNPRLNGWVHCNPLICFLDKPKKIHHVEVRMQPGDEDKEFTILGFGVVR